MKTLTILSVIVLLLFSFVIGVFAQASDEVKHKSSIAEANVWITEDGKKHYICPVMGEEGIVDSKTASSVVNGKRYYYCCAGCSEKFAANPSKYLENFVIPRNVIKVDKDGKHYKCPISGEIGLVSEKTLYSDYDGKRYYFCCVGYKNKFDATPEKSLKSEKSSKCSPSCSK